jgi:hypothetical protein
MEKVQKPSILETRKADDGQSPKNQYSRNKETG